ncbi:peptidase S1 [Brevundimonas aurifodinae]|uniref:Peptidase S1 n=2 Tax=Brevundimonas TaxID=41275 RepID=A0ABV1NLN7_9CAUL|nr:MAG: peptidase S1 [Brevundimonas sp. 12-68-7]OYX36091.1 MAG: peptidase S1 [Brevundimonas subvibrioides]
MRALSLVCALALVAAASTAAAQDPSLNASSGGSRHNAGFSPDPITVSIYSGGGVDASRSIGGSCVGMIAEAPDYEFTYRAGSWPLTFAVDADTDTSLVINAPDGRWYCVDDSEGLNPVLRWGTPQSGSYDIWVGAVGQAGPSTLYITEQN